ncbi:hypothetical protein [Methanobacterium sp.]|uniref:hypothetical protein n=1 Tax=Methanobacterium sp. TaxID=2164 RepID=UPI003D65D2FA
MLCKIEDFTTFGNITIIYKILKCFRCTKSEISIACESLKISDFYATKTMVLSALIRCHEAKACKTFGFALQTLRV